MQMSLNSRVTSFVVCRYTEPYKCRSFPYYKAYESGILITALAGGHFLGVGAQEAGFATKRRHVFPNEVSVTSFGTMDLSKPERVPIQAGNVTQK